MKAGTGHDVCFYAQDRVDLLLQVDKLDQAESRVIRIEEEVDIAVGSALVARDGPEQIKMRYTKAMKVALVFSQRRKHLFSVHFGPPR